MATVQGAVLSNETIDSSALLAALLALKDGDPRVRLPYDWVGIAGKVADTFNQIAAQNERMAEELHRLSRVVGKEGKLSQRGTLGDVHGFWRDSIDSVNELIDDLVHPTTEAARVIGAVAQGDLSQTIALAVDDRPLQGEFLRTARSINTMVAQLGSFASEVTWVAREVGTEGKLGGQAQVKGVAGTWKDLTDSVNSMAGNLTAQVRSIAEVTVAVANGDLSKKIAVDVEGELLELKNTINTMVDQLRSFASEVTDLSPLLLNELGDDRETIGLSDSVVVILENDASFARLLMETAREKGFKVLATSLGAAGLALIRQHKPAVVTLDIVLPDVDGWRVLERLKNDLATRHIPVCIISTEDSRDQAQRAGVFRFTCKPIQEKEVIDRLLDEVLRHSIGAKKKVGLLGPDGENRRQMIDLIQSEEFEIRVADDFQDLIEIMQTGGVDCLVTLPAAGPIDHSRLADATGAAGIECLPVLAYGEGQQDGERDPAWKAFGSFILRHVHSPERLIDQVAFFLHIPLDHLPKEKQEMIVALHQSDKLLAGKRVLIVDDDMRNIFALSAVLEEHEMDVLSADNGVDAIRILQEMPDLDIVLMDIMMPEMDGLETIQEIRKIPKLRNTPIIAVTAKAMKGDRERCIEAGAWDYLAKPVDTTELLAVLRAWLYR